MNKMEIKLPNESNAKIETDYLLKSPANALHLMNSIDQNRQLKVTEKEITHTSNDYSYLQ
ncbi:MAG TPA: hypothetical protein EYH12_01715 [Psychromonas hadalis]|nr:hypothetical protein [Psychromonas hadalis]